MAQFEIDPDKVADLVSSVMHTLDGKRVHLADIVIALSEANGRVIAAQDISPVAMQELHQICTEHLERTIRIGAANKGLQLGGH